MDNIGNIAASRVSQAMQGVTARFSEIEQVTGLSFSAYMLRAQLLQSVGVQTETEETSEMSVSGTEDLSASGTGTTSSAVIDLTENYTFPQSAGDTFSALPQSAYDDLILEAAAQYGVNPAIIKAVCFAESSFREGAVSAAGAMGLMQLMPYTAEALGVEDPFDPAQNVDGGARLLSSLLDKYDGDALLAVAAYNCGANGISSRGITDLKDETQRSLLPSETLGYIERIEEYLESRQVLSVLDNPYAV